MGVCIIGINESRGEHETLQCLGLKPTDTVPAQYVKNMTECGGLVVLIKNKPDLMAKVAGVKSGDALLAINGEKVDPRNHRRALSVLEGHAKEGEKITLKIKRKAWLLKDHGNGSGNGKKVDG